MRRRMRTVLTALTLCFALCVSASAMTIYVKTPDAETLTLEVVSGDSIDNVRDKLKAQDSRTAQWWLSYQDSYLAYGRTLADYNIQEESTLRLNASKEIQASTKDQMFSAVKDNAVQVVTLTADIEIEEALTVSRAVTLDLNGHVLKYKGNLNSSVIRVADGGDLTIQDSSPDTVHKFTPNSDGLWVPDETNGTETVTGGIITGGTGTDVASPGGMAQYRGGGVLIETGGSLTMTGGNIAGCTAHDGGGVFMAPGGTFTMSGGSILHCAAIGVPSSGGGVHMDGGSFIMSAGEIRACKCIAASNRARGGGVYMGGGSDFTMSGGSIADDCTAAGGGGGVCNEDGKLYANGGEIAGDVMNGTPEGKYGTITGSGDTRFSGKVINGDGGKITGGTFTGKVTNNGEITGGTFTGEVTGSGSITGAPVVTVSAQDALRAALEGGDSAEIKLSADIEIDTSLTVSRTVTLDLNGCVLRVTSDYNSVIEVKDGGALTLTDSAPDTTHYYSVNSDTKLWTILPDAAGAAGSIQGGIITGGSTGLGGGVMIRTGGTLTMNGGAIAGCRVNGQGGGVYVCNGREADEALKELARGVFTMNGGSIIGCAAKNSMGGSVYIKNATRRSDYNGLFIMNGGSISDSGVSSGREEYNTIYNIGTFIANGGTVTNSGSGPYNYALFTDGIFETKQGFSGTEFFGVARTDRHSGESGGTFNGGIFNGKVLNYDRLSGGVFKSDVINDDSEIAGGTFCGTVTNRNNGRITGGVFESESIVINDGDKPRCGIIIGGTFHGSVTNDGKITGGIFYGTVSGAGTIEGSVERTVSFDTDGGSAVDAQKVLRGQKAAEPTSCEKAGYTFAGWYRDTSPYDFTTPVLEDFTLKAAWTANRYTITFDTDGGSAVDPITQDCGTPVAAPAAPVKDGWSFAGWEPALPATMPAENLTVTAKWTADVVVCTVTFDANGHGSAPASQTVSVNGTVTLPGMADDGRWRFRSWTTGGVSYPAGEVYTVTADTTFTALWDNTAPAPSGGGGGGSGRGGSYTASVDDVKNGAIAVSPKSAAKGDTVTITVTPDKGYTLETLTVLDRDGREVALTRGEDGRYTFIMPEGGVTVKGSFMEDNAMLNFFTDVPADAYYHDAVAWAIEHGITTGTTDATFSPGEPCTRAQIVTFLWRAAGCPVVNYVMPFDDVDEGGWYAEAVRWAASAGIANGTGGAAFSPDDVCTRAQAVTILFRYAISQGMSAVTLADRLSGFGDAGEVPAYAVSAMQWAIAAGVVQGDGANLAPGEECTRAQIVTMLYRHLA